MPHPQPTATSASDLARDWPDWPLYGLADDLLPAIERWAAAGRRVAVATLVDIVGSSPRPLGSEMAICENGEVAGYVSGGCVEGAVATEALQVLKTGTPRLLDYGAGSPVLDIQLTCGGRIGIFVRALADAGAYAAHLRTTRERRTPARIAIGLHGGAHTWMEDGDAAANVEGPYFVKTWLPPTRLLVAGGNPVALALAAMAAPLGYTVTLLRPYGPAEPPPGIPLARYDRRALAVSLADLQLDAWTAVYSVTHHAEEDLAVLLRALPSPAFCVGVLGSRSKLAARLARLRAAGLDPRTCARLKAPAGLAIGAQRPQEIALAMLAQVVSLQPAAQARLVAGDTGRLPDTLAATAYAGATPR